MTRNAHILIVDDEAPIRESLAFFLEDCDFAVSTAETAEAALHKLQEKRCDAVLVDMRLPDMDGETFVRQGFKLSPTTAFLIHTGSADFILSPELRALGLSPAHVFFKPITNLNAFAESLRKLASTGVG